MSKFILSENGFSKSKKNPALRNYWADCINTADACRRISNATAWKHLRTTKPFFETNALLYLLSAHARKADQAEAILAEDGTISVQVLNEFASVASRKLGMSYTEIRDTLSIIRGICDIQTLTVETHELGLTIAERFGFFPLRRHDRQRRFTVRLPSSVFGRFAAWSRNRKATCYYKSFLE
jgi:hypothetical protein